MLKTEWLEAFRVFAETRNLTRAAERLHLSQPALHVQIAKLSERVGATLYLRQGRELVLTEEGMRVAAFAREFRDGSDALRAELAGATTAARVTLSAGEGSYLYLLGPAISRFRRHHAGSLRLLTGNRQETIEAVRTGAAQVGVTTGGATPEDLESSLLTEVWQVAVLPARHPLTRRRRLRLTDLDGESLVVPPPGRPHREAVESALAAAGVEWRAAVEASGWELMLHFVKLGLGIAVVNGCCAVPRGLVARRLDELPRLRYETLARRRARHPEPVAALLGILADMGDAWSRQAGAGRRSKRRVER